MIHSFLGINDISGVYWSLAVELKFYFLIFLVLAFRQLRRLPVLLGMWLAISFWLSLHNTHGAARFFLFPEWSSYFIAGATLFLIHREGPSAYKLSIVAGCCFLSIAYALGWAPVGGGAMEPGTHAVVLAGLLALFYLVFLGIALRPRHSQASSRFCLLGLITYPLYLLHQDLGFILLRAAPLSWNRYVRLAIAVSSMITLSWFVHVHPERWLAFRLKAAFAAFNKLAKSKRFQQHLANESIPAGTPVSAVSVPSEQVTTESAPVSGK